MRLQRFIYRHRLSGKRVVAMVARILPASASRRVRALAERVAFNLTPAYQGETLPPIFSYWSRAHLAPAARALGIESPEMLYLDQAREAAMSGDVPVRILSLGSGACSMEIQLAMALRAEGIAFRLTCADVNPRLMRAGADLARDCGISESMRFITIDCNKLFKQPAHDVIIVNQFFHHVEDLPTLCRSLQDALAPHGVLLSSDIIGRNGHLLWPDVATAVESAWAQLPADKRMDRHFGRLQTHYQPIDHAAYSSEGVHAQDVVGALAHSFDFELFFTFGGAIMPFVERRIGFNFDPDNAADRAFIDAMHASDAQALAEARYPASNMIAALRHKGRVRQPCHVPVTPQQHIALVQAQCRKIRPGHVTRQSDTA